MSALEFFTTTSVVILIVGPIAVFVWFLVDAARLLRSLPKRRRVKDRTQ